MITKMVAITHSTLIGEIFEEDHNVVVFESNTSLCRVFESFTLHLYDTVLISENSAYVGIVTLKDMMRILHDLDNLLLPIRDFMVTPLLTFDSTQTIAEVLETIEKHFCEKIVVKDTNQVIGIIDYSELLAICFKKITMLISDEYNILHSMAGLAKNGEKELLKLATTDSLTGIGNRRLFEETYQAHQLVLGKYNPALHLLIFDIDDFKAINDTYGHNIGDIVLKELAELVSNSIRQSDVFVRWGGEEFAILLRYSKPERVIKIAEHVCTAINHHNFVAAIRITCSFGLTKIYSFEDLETVIDRADKALYRAKLDGKNCVRILSV
jgi:diguanylate cyclase (GGDEF)-like protein